MLMSVLVMSLHASAATNTLVVNAVEGNTKINKNIYGHFSEHLGRGIYEGYWVGEDSDIPNTNGIRNDVVEALKRIQVPVLRWPGGCFADEYHWKDGVGPRNERPSIVNTHWGGVTENNHFGTHEFLELCAQLGCDPYISGNLGSGTVEELSQWVEYVNFEGISPMADQRRMNGRDKPWEVRYWAVGNESWGCGGNMTPEYYANLYRQFQTYVRAYPGAEPYKIACGPYGNNYRWTEVIMQNIPTVMMQGLSYHYYSGMGNTRSAADFDEEGWFRLLASALKIDEYLQGHIEIMNEHDPGNRVALIVDEWGTWHGVEPGTNPGFLFQQNTLRDAMVAGITFNVFHKHSKRVKMANIAQVVNVLQAMILTQDEKMVLTPTYHVFEMYKVHQDATHLSVTLNCADYKHRRTAIPSISASASRDSDGNIHLSLCNLHPSEPAELECKIDGAACSTVSGRILTAETINAHNTFENPDAVKPGSFDDAQLTDTTLTTTLPPKSIVVLKLK
jgi:alpha-N-arabinofuranosidase